MTETAISETRGFLESGGRPLYATLIRPAEPVAGLVLNGPFGEEKKCAARLLVRLARQGAERGLATLLVDLSATGESPGCHAEATLAQWGRDLANALAAARKDTPKIPWSVGGFRLGANLAALTASASPAPAQLLLVEPLLAGADYLRDLQRRRQIKQMMGGAREHAQEAPEEIWAEGKPVDFSGFAIGSQLAGELAGMVLGATLQRVPQTCRTHLLRVAANTTFPPAWKPLVDQVGQRFGTQPQTIRDKPFWGQLEYYESDLVIDACLACLLG